MWITIVVVVSLFAFIISINSRISFVLYVWQDDMTQWHRHIVMTWWHTYDRLTWHDGMDTDEVGEGGGGGGEEKGEMFYANHIMLIMHGPRCKR